MIDVHTHLIPGVDDGAEDLTMALTMMLRARDQGIAAVIATPHSMAFDADAALVHARFHQLQQRAKVVFPDMGLYLGCEVYCQEERMPEVLKALDSGVYPTMNGTGYVLAEFSQWITPERALSCVKALAAGGYTPLVAHMERYAHLHNQEALVWEVRELGARIQVNAYSLYDEQDPEIKNWARKLVENQWVDFLGTDAHRTYHRPPCAQMGLKWLYENTPKEYADELSFGNARSLLGMKEGGMEHGTL